MPTAIGLSASHPAIAAYARQQGLAAEAFRRDGRITLRFQGRYRVQVRPASSGRIALTARLADLSGHSPADTDRTLLRLAAIGASMLRDHAAGLAIDEAERSLMLQQQLPPDTDAALLEDELAGFVHTLTVWTHACAFERLARPA